jgi:ubiquinone/menaquinone biosynthesis C-methylase UbiE
MDFDQFADRYQGEVNAAAGVSVERLAAEKARLIVQVLGKEVDIPKRLRVLDIGCGIGAVDRELESEVGELYGIDVSLESLKFALVSAPATRFVHYDGSHLPFADAAFDAVFAVCVLHHVPPIARSAFVAETLRSIRPGGAAILIEHNRHNPVTRRIVSRCAFDADAVLLSCREAAKLLAEGGASVGGRRYVGFWPFRHDLVERAERALGWLPMGAQYCIWGFKQS